ncbi:MAG: hypothetical protein R2940_08265 [Syntrophotaleaceae bacterium]
MKRWRVLGLPLAIALLALGIPAQGSAIEDSNVADNMSLAVQDNLNYNDVAAVNSAIIEDNLNGPIGNDTQVAKQAANDQSVAVDDSLNDNNVAFGNSAIIEDNLNGPIGNDIQVAKQAANDNSVVVDDITDVGNFDSSLTIGDIDVKVAASVLSGSVAFNYIGTGYGLYGGKVEVKTGDNCFAHGDNFSANGIFTNSQNTGLMSQTQQSISVQANLINQAAQ